MFSEIEIAVLDTVRKSMSASPEALRLYWGDLVFEADLVKLCQFCVYFKSNKCEKLLTPVNATTLIFCNKGKPLKGNKISFRRFDNES